METKSFASKIVNVEERDVTGITAVMGVLDAGNDLLFKGAFTKTIQERGDRVKHLWQHDNTMPPIAAVLDLHEVGRMDLPQDMKDKFPEAKGGLMVKRRYLETPRGDEVLAGLKSEPAAITEMSFGYDPVKFDFEEIKADDLEFPMLIRNLREVRLWDTSDVNWGMNEATVANVKSVMPYKDCGMADENKDWKKPSLGDFTDNAWEDLSEAEKKRIAGHFTFSVNMPPESFGDLKLPHHEPAKSGVGPSVWNGVRAAMGALMGARGGVKGIPEADMKKCYSHLSKHYEQFNKEPPDMKVLQLLESVSDVLGWLEKDQPALFQVESIAKTLQELNDLLRAEPPSPMDAALTLKMRQADLLRRFEIKKRSLYSLSN